MWSSTNSEKIPWTWVGQHHASADNGLIRLDMIQYVEKMNVLYFREINTMIFIYKPDPPRRSRVDISDKIPSENLSCVHSLSLAISINTISGVSNLPFVLREKFFACDPTTARSSTRESIFWHRVNRNVSRFEYCRWTGSEPRYETLPYLAQLPSFCWKARIIGTRVSFWKHRLPTAVFWRCLFVRAAYTGTVSGYRNFAGSRMGASL